MTQPINSEEQNMDGTYDKVKGRIKKAAGELTDDDEMRRDGARDETAGKAKDVVERGKRRLDDAIDDAADRADR